MRIVQVTDPHLFADPRERLRGVPTDAALAEVLHRIEVEAPDSDLCIVTGDIAQDESIETYRRFRDILDALACPVRLIPGNHDNPAAMREVFGDLVDPGTRGFGFVARSDAATVVGLDSHVPGQVHGEIGEQDLGWLQGIDPRGLPLIVSVHHPPVSIGTDWLDAMALADGERLLEILAGYDTQVAVVHGHTHQESHVRVGAIDIYGTPSTAFQFAPGCDRGQTDSQPSGFRVVEVDERRIHTRVHRLPVAGC